MGRYVFKLPDVGEGVAEAEIVAWHVAEGAMVAEDQPLVDVMTDKATVEISAPVAGQIVSMLGAVGDTAAIGAPIVIFETATPTEEPAAAPADAHPRQPEDPEPARRAIASALTPTSDPGAEVLSPSRAIDLRHAPASGQKPLATPSVRRFAYEKGVPLQFVRGTGPSGRILQKDVEDHIAFAANPVRPAKTPNGDAVQVVKVIGLRRRVAERMAEAHRRIVHFSYIEEVDMTELERLRTHLIAEHSERPRLTILPFLSHALVRALADFPQMNALYDDEAGLVRRYQALHLGVATQTPAGLMVPVVRHAEGLDLWATAAEIARLAKAAREGKASPAELTGSTITITSLGPLGGVATTPIINAPEVAIIGPNRIVERPVALNGAIVLRKMMNLSCSFDHRIIDGVEAAEFVQRLKRLIETPALIFVEAP